jgi:hypothetical protein
MRLKSGAGIISLRERSPDIRSKGEDQLQRKMRGLDTYLDEYEAEHGAFTEDELARASRKLGLPWPPEDGRDAEEDVEGRDRVKGLVLDAGALIALDRGNRDMHSEIRATRLGCREPGCAQLEPSLMAA